MIRFAEVFPDAEIVHALSAQLGWSHFKAIIPLKDPLQREFYAEMCRVERWSTRTLANKLDSSLYERTAISKKPEEVAKAELASLRNEDQLTPDLVFRDPYILDFLGLRDRYLEKDLEDAILREIESFLLELDQSGIHVAEYLTALPSRELLQQKLHTAIEVSRARLESRSKEEQ
jgi:predicted nuclease of restriction endonuclease-like (RecB) superfamily